MVQGKSNEQNTQRCTECRGFKGEDTNRTAATKQHKKCQGMAPAKKMAESNRGNAKMNTGCKQWSYENLLRNLTEKMILIQIVITRKVENKSISLSSLLHDSKIIRSYQQLNNLNKQKANNTTAIMAKQSFWGKSHIGCSSHNLKPSNTGIDKIPGQSSGASRFRGRASNFS